MKKIYLVDTFSFLFRAYYAVPSMVTQKGFPTNALYGLVAMLVKLIRDTRPEYMAFCYDLKEGSFRNKIYSEYKANRTEPPEDLIPQFAYVRRITEALGAMSFDREGFEADDIIGSLVQMAVDQNREVVIVSGDKDFAQLISSKVIMFDSMKNKIYDPEGVITKWGVRPEQMVDYLALVGDSSDNVPGVKGIGPKGAQKLLAEYENLDGIYKNIDNISGVSLKQKLSSSKEMAYLSQDLVTIRKNIPFSIGVEDLKRKDFNKESLSQIFSELEFKNFEKKLYESEDSNESFEDNMLSTKSKNSSAKKTSSSDSAKKTSSSDSAKKTSSSDSATKLSKSVAVSSGCESSAQKVSLSELDKVLEPHSSVWCVVFEKNIYLECKNKYYELESIDFKSAGALLSAKLVKWKGFDLKSIWKRLEVDTSLFPSPEWDQMLAAYVIKPKNIESFDKVYEEYLNKPFENEATGIEQIEMHKELEKILKKKLKEQEGEGVLKELDLPLISVLYDMETFGIGLDTKELENQQKDLSADIESLKKIIFKEADEEFNVASPKQLSVILFDKMGINPIKKTKTGYSTNSDVLESLKKDHPICKNILEFRELAKLKSTYIDSLLHLLDKKTKRVHTDFRQALTTTGRLSSSHPNLQNIPIKTTRGRRVRRAFVANKGFQFISADYSQIELRILAHITGDKNLNKAFMEGKDIHQATASEIFSISLQDVTPQQRRIAKTVNFGISYGQGVYGLSETLGVSRKESKEIIDRYFKKFKSIQDYMLETVEEAKNRGYVETIFGRRRYLDEFQSNNARIIKSAERAAINAPIQGSVSDIVKRAMIEVNESVSAKMILQVHDELIFECEQEDLEEQAQLIKKIMESTITLSVPLIVNTSTGSRWDEVH